MTSRHRHNGEGTAQCGACLSQSGNHGEPVMTVYTLTARFDTCCTLTEDELQGRAIDLRNFGTRKPF